MIGSAGPESAGRGLPNMSGRGGGSRRARAGPERGGGSRQVRTGLGQMGEVVLAAGEEVRGVRDRGAKTGLVQRDQLVAARRRGADRLAERAEERQHAPDGPGRGEPEAGHHGWQRQDGTADERARKLASAWAEADELHGVPILSAAAGGSRRAGQLAGGDQAVSSATGFPPGSSPSFFAGSKGMAART